jgi:riboflavin kinase/FMN adenylyltransferase
MRVVEWSGERAPDPTVCAVGVFDGVHLGHQALLRDTVAIARSEGVEAAVLTFEPDPDTVLAAAEPPDRIVTREDRRAHIEAQGIDRLVEVPFDQTLASMEPERFLEDVVDPALAPLALVVGRDFVFGRRGAGDVALMRRHGAENDYAVFPHELVAIEGAPVTATRIRRAVAHGEVALAARLLGRPHLVRGRVVRGRGEGVALGVPTANLEVPDGMLVPGDGVYACRADSDATGPVMAAVSVGAPPTFPGVDSVVEAHLLDVDATLYGEELAVEFVERVRSQRPFASNEALSEAIAADVEHIRHLLEG